MLSLTPVWTTIIPIYLSSCRLCYIDAPHERWQSIQRKSSAGIAHEGYKSYPRSNIPQSRSCTATYLPPTSKTSQIRQTIHAGYCRRSKNELRSDILQWTPSHGRANVGRPTRTYRQQLFTDTGCSLKDLPEATDDSEEWRERESGKSVRAAWW